MNEKTAKSLKQSVKIRLAEKGLPFRKNTYRKVNRLYNTVPSKLRSKFSVLFKVE